MRQARIVSLEVRQKAARIRKAKFEATQQTTKTGAIATLVFMGVLIVFIASQYV